MNNPETVFIDGSTGEGGGQILRTALSLSCITGRSLRMENIRAARRNPGLAKQHLSCVQAACRISNAECQGAAKGSQVLEFQPRTVQSGNFHFDIGSAGSATLVIQTLLPPLFLTDRSSVITVTGGTHNPLAPPFDFLSETFLPAIATTGFHGRCKLLRYGFFPAGGGKITFNVHPLQQQPSQTIDFCRPAEQFQISAKMYTAKLPEHIAARQRELLLQSKLAEPTYACLERSLDDKNIQQIEITDTDGPGNCVMLRLHDGTHTTVFTAFGMKGKSSQKVVREVTGMAGNFLASGAAIDHFLADQLLIYMAIAKAGRFTTNTISNHLSTNMEIIKKFLPVEFDIAEHQGFYKVSCQTA